MEEKFYLVCYVGMYSNGEGCHTTYLYDNEKSASAKFCELMKETIEEYRERDNYDDWVGENWYSLHSWSGDKVDILVQEIKPNGEQNVCVL